MPKSIINIIKADIFFCPSKLVVTNTLKELTMEYTEWHKNTPSILANLLLLLAWLKKLGQIVEIPEIYNLSKKKKKKKKKKGERKPTQVKTS